MDAALSIREQNSPSPSEHRHRFPPSGSLLKAWVQTQPLGADSTILQPVERKPPKRVSKINKISKRNMQKMKEQGKKSHNKKMKSK